MRIYSVLEDFFDVLPGRAGKQVEQRHGSLDMPHLCTAILLGTMDGPWYVSVLILSALI